MSANMEPRHRQEPVPPLIPDLEPPNMQPPSSLPDSPIDEAGTGTGTGTDTGTGTGRLELSNQNFPTPLFMQDEGAWMKFKWVPYPVLKVGKIATQWVKGPAEPYKYTIQPLFPSIQLAPLRYVDKFLPQRRQKIWGLAAYLVCWLVAFCLTMRHGLKSSEIQGYGEPSSISCGSTYWSAGNACGIDGNDCRPFVNSSFAFRCPASCASYQVLNPRAVGTQEVIYRPLIIGGPPDPSTELDAVYRGDSYICGSAIHAGVASNAHGGCGVVELVGRQSNYTSTTRHGITSVGFDSYFPLSFTFRRGVDCDASDVRWSLLGFSATFSAVLSLFTASAPVLYFPVFSGIFWQVGMASDAPPHYGVPDLFSDILGKFLPAMFCAWVVYDKMCVRRTLTGLTAQVEKTMLWLGMFWVGALSNYTLGWIPIQRLNAHDLQQQPGAKVALAVIIIVLLVAAVTQIRFLRQEGRLVSHLKLYGLFVAVIVICLFLPGLRLRIHHYTLALLLLPGTSMQTRPSLLYQGLLLGLFVNGIARWGFDPFLQTSFALQGDAQLESPLPAILAPVLQVGGSVSNITFQFGASPGIRYDGISGLVNDVERYRAYFADGNETSFVWSRNSSLGLDEYFRFAYMEGSSSADYTKAGIWDAQGNWVSMAPGPSRIKSRKAVERELRR